MISSRLLSSAALTLGVVVQLVKGNWSLWLSLLVGGIACLMKVSLQSVIKPAQYRSQVASQTAPSSSSSSSSSI